MKRLALIAALAFAFPALAQDTTTFTQQQIGSTLLTNGLLDGRPLTGSTNRIGNTDFTILSHGDRTTTCTSSTIGNTAFTSCY